MSEELSMTKTEPAMEVAPAGNRLDAVEILRAAVAGGVTSENVAVVERMVALVERQQQRRAEQAYVVALAALQKECQNVIAASDVNGKYRYAKYIQLWNAVRPAVERNGFTLEWSQEHLGDRVKKLLYLCHVDGYRPEKPKEWTIRLGTSAAGIPAGMQLPVLDEMADSMAKRRLLMDALNIVVDAVTSAEDVGDGTLVSQEESDALFQRLIILGGDEHSQKRFLALAGVEAWNQIPKAVLPILNRLLAEKERVAARKGAT